jgi:hypothetical protein
MFAGSLVALVTPMQPDGSIDFNAWTRLLEFQVANGTVGIVVAGSTGESATVTDAELRDLLLSARKVLGKRALLIANTGTNSTASSVDRARDFSALDIDALLVSSPSYVRPTQEVCSCTSPPSPTLRASRASLQRAGSHRVDVLPATVRDCRVCRASSASRRRSANASRVRELVAGCGADSRSLGRRPDRA